MLVLLVEDAPENDRLGASYAAATAAGFEKVISNIYLL